MQGMLESLLVADGAVFLEERGLTPMVVPLFDDLISPRNLAIIASLPTTSSQNSSHLATKK